MSEIIVGLDIGTANVRAVIGELSENGQLIITGIGTSVSTGLRSGLIVNIEATVQSIKKAVDSAEQMAGIEVENCYTAIGGSQIESLLSKGLVAITAKGRGSREITQTDIDRVIEAAKAVNIPLDRQILHVVPRSYIVDGQGGIPDPLNMLGVRLEAEVCIFTSSGTATQNFLRCAARAGYGIEGVMLKTLAIAQAVLTKDEKELGSVIIDLGAGTTDGLILVDGTPMCAVSVPAGGFHVTNDISLVKGVSFETAESIKRTDGCCWESLVDDSEPIIIPGIAGNAPQEIKRSEIALIIQSRIEEIFDLLMEKLPPQVKKQRLNGSVILSGGGALLPGITELTSQKFKTENVRIALPTNLGGLVEKYRTPEYATVIGLLVENKEQLYNRKNSNAEKKRKHNNSIGEKIKSFFSEFF
ncbi:MAG TPA: cell division protein FtsA [Treponemataceae bacterium]|nr:cell division protein FtsA [Treponemataceae bacterium]